MHGANNAVRTAGRSACRLHDRRFRRLPLQSLQTHRCGGPARSRIVVTAFRSPATAAPRSASIPGSKLPACYFRSPLGFRPARSASGSTPAVGSHQRAVASTPQARYRTSTDRYPPSLRPPLPFGTLTSLRIKAFCLGPAGRPAVRIRPISVRSPLPSSYELGCGSPFPVRYVSVG